MTNLDQPAFPLGFEIVKQIEAGYHHQPQSGFTKREQACLLMGVPDSGDEELNEIIKKGNIQKWAAMAVQGLLANTDTNRVEIKAVIKLSKQYAHILAGELDKTKTL